MKVLRNILIAFALLAIAGCGGGASYKAQEAVSTPDDLGELTVTEKLLYSEAYSGYLVIFLNEAMGTRLSGQRRLFSTTDYDNELSHVQQILDAHPTAIIKRSVSTDPDKLDARRTELEQLSGKRLKDFNSIYHVYIDDPDEGVRLMRDLGELGVVERAYPKLRLEQMDLSQTPDLMPHQGYLYAESTHGGLNAVAAWSAGVRGEGVVVVDGDTDWYLDHADLSIDGPDFELVQGGCNHGSTDPDCPKYMAHGTAMSGIVAGLDNGHGITGIAPNVELYGASVGYHGQAVEGGDLGDILIEVSNNDPSDRELPPGSIFFIVVGVKGPNTPGQTCLDTPHGCLPGATDPEIFSAITNATAHGITIIMAAGNGEQDLDDPGSYYTYSVDLSLNETDAILVGAGNGSAKQKTWFTNYGSALDLFAWGEGVVSTTYPIQSNPSWTWQGTTAPLPPLPMDTDAYFVDIISGTSPATAEVAAAAALIQSYAKQVAGETTTRYLMPTKMKEILVQSGVSQVGGGGNIGVQPRVDVAMGLVDAAWASWSASYPELISGQDLSSGEVASLRQSGLGIICVNGDPASSDPTCPDDALNVPGTGIAVTMDFDGDDRADLVQWTRGQFKIDLAGVAGGDDGFGAWDVIINYPTTGMSDVVWPYVEDMNSDLRTDLVLYDKVNGVWYIAYMNSAMLSGSGFQGWDHVITTNIADTREMDPWDSMYCRPHPDDYDNDGWTDLAVACSDGVWYMEYNNAGSWPSSITYADDQFQYLSAQQLAVAPGWAYLTSAADIDDASCTYIFVKTPDGLPEAGRIKNYASPSFSMDFFDGTVPHIFGGNNNVMLLGEFALNSFLSIGLKSADGQWAVAEPNSDYSILESPQPYNIWGDISCHPVAADFDGDGQEDRAVMCPDEWRISYSGDDYPQFKDNSPYYRHVELTYDTDEFSLPGRSYSGNISYEAVLHLLEMFQGRYPNDPPPIIVDMVSIVACQRVSGNECQ